jgi:sugar phosphate isomerase/epimerase
MYLSIRDDVVFAAGYDSLAVGLKDLGIAAVELFVRDRTENVVALEPTAEKPRLNLSDPDDLAELQRQTQVHGIKIAALCMGNNFNADDKDAEIAWAVRTVRAASTLGIPAIRIDAIMHGEQDLPLDTRQRIIADAVMQILAETADTPVDLGMENHGFQGNDPEFLRGLLARIDSPRFGLTLDSGNFYWRGWALSRVYEIFAEFAPYVVHTHIKNIAYPPELREIEREMGWEYGKYVSPIHQGDIDHSRYFEVLQNVGYNRDLCLEDESLSKYPPEQRQANLRDAAAFFHKQINTAQ